MTPDDDDGAAAWTNEYEAWCAEQDDEDEVNRLLDEASHDDDR